MATETMQPVAVRLPEDLIEELKAVAEREDRTLAQTIRRALKRYLNEASAA